VIKYIEIRKWQLENNVPAPSLPAPWIIQRAALQKER